MPASAATKTRRWRSNLRRLQTLTVWHRQAAAASSSDAKSGKASRPSILARKLKRKRCPSAGAGQGKACAVFPACRASQWQGTRARRGKKACAPQKARLAAASAEREKLERKAKKQASAPEAKPAAGAEEVERSEKKKKAEKQASAPEAARQAEVVEEAERSAKKAKKQAAAAEAAKLAAAAEEEAEREEEEEERRRRKKAKREAASAEAAKLAAAAEEEEKAVEDERSRRKRAKKEAQAAAAEASRRAVAVEEEEGDEERPKKKEAKKEAPSADDSPEPAAAEEAKASKPPKGERAAASRARPSIEGSLTLALALTAEDLKKRTGAKPASTPPLPAAAFQTSSPSEAGKAKLEPRQPANPPAVPPPPRAKADPAAEIPRILNAQSPEELLEVDPSCGEEAVTKAWKRLVLLLHPDKLHGLDDATRQAGQDALNFVHMAREELKRRTQEKCAEVPADPEAASPPRLLEANSGARKYEISWRLPETQDPGRPVERYEIWGPRYFSEAGEPFDPVLLATLPPLQCHFVLVEEAPTQQDVMWAADRVLRPSLPLTVHAANGKGSSGALTFELPWSSVFPWLQGTTSVLCPQCLRLNARRQNWTRCGGCGYNVPPEASIIVRCPECHGEALWNRVGELNCSCCLLRLGQAHDQFQQQNKPWSQQKPPRGHVPPPNFAGSARGGRHY